MFGMQGGQDGARKNAAGLMVVCWGPIKCKVGELGSGERARSQGSDRAVKAKRKRAEPKGRAEAKPKPRRQYAAFPLATGDDGQTLVMLVTSRETRRWVIPKGNPEKGLAPHELAAKEAYEEAGLVGEVGREPVGRYRYLKRLRGEKTMPCEVEVFPLAVGRQLDDWPGKGRRETRWFTPAEAATLVGEGGLVTLLLHLAAEVSSC